MTGTGMNILHCRQTHSPLWSICESSSAISDEAARRSVRYWFDNLLRVEFRDAFHSSEESSSMIDSQNELMNDETWIFSCWNEIIWSSLWRCQLSVMSDDALWYFELSIFYFSFMNTIVYRVFIPYFIIITVSFLTVRYLLFLSSGFQTKFVEETGRRLFLCFFYYLLSSSIFNFTNT